MCGIPGDWPDGPVPLQCEHERQVDLAAERDVPHGVECDAVGGVQGLRGDLPADGLQQGQGQVGVVEEHQGGQHAVEDVLHLTTVDEEGGQKKTLWKTFIVMKCFKPNRPSVPVF